MTEERPGLARRSLDLWERADRWGVHELLMVVVAFLLYFFIRGAVVDRHADAVANAKQLIDLEKALGFHWELSMQGWIIDSRFWIRAMNWIYFWGHMPLIIAFAIWLYFRHRRTYTLVRNAFLASGAIAIVVYALYPVAPPRLIVGSGFVDTMAVYDKIGYQTQESKAFVNPYAAMPSLHFGWSMLLAAAVAWVGRNRWFVAFGIAWPVAMFFSVVLTANHWIIDAVAGAVVSFAGFGIALLIEQRIWPAMKARWERLAGAGPPGDVPGQPLEPAAAAEPEARE